MDRYNAYSKYEIENHNWVPISESVPKSFRVCPGWISVKSDGGNDLVFLSEDCNYFISVDHKRVYRIDEISAWTTNAVPTRIYE